MLHSCPSKLDSGFSRIKIYSILTPPTLVGIQKHLERYLSGGVGERNHYQCPLVQETMKGSPLRKASLILPLLLHVYLFADKKAALIGKVLVLGDYRMFIFEKAQVRHLVLSWDFVSWHDLFV